MDLIAIGAQSPVDQVRRQCQCEDRFKHHRVQDRLHASCRRVQRLKREPQRPLDVIYLQSPMQTKLDPNLGHRRFRSGRATHEEATGMSPSHSRERTRPKVAWTSHAIALTPLPAHHQRQMKSRLPTVSAQTESRLLVAFPFPSLPASITSFRRAAPEESMIRSHSSDPVPFSAPPFRLPPHAVGAPRGSFEGINHGGFVIQTRVPFSTWIITTFQVEGISKQHDFGQLVAQPRNTNHSIAMANRLVDTST